jgi:hypothetical protein
VSRAVRPTKSDEVAKLSDDQLAAYIADTRYRISSVGKASLRNDYRKQLEAAERVRAERSA